MEKSIEIMRQIEATHRGLGVSVLFGDICFLAKTSVFYIAEKGKGKGTTISSIKTDPLDPDYDMLVDNLTLSEMGNRNQLQACVGQTLVWRIKEWSTMNHWNRNLFLTIGSKLISDREYYHFISGGKGKELVINIKDTDLICYIGIQPLKLARMMLENENWETMASDRFIKWTMLNPLREKSYDFHPVYDMPEFDYNMKPEIPDEPTLLMKMLDRQISPERLAIYAQHLLRGFCILEGIQNPDIKTQLEFVKLFGPHITLYPKFLIHWI